MPRSKGMQNLVEFMVADVMLMTDDEILAESTPEEIEQAQRAWARALEAATEEVILGGRGQPTRQTALRLRGNGFEAVEIDDSRKIIEPPTPCPRCRVFLCAEHVA